MKKILILGICMTLLVPIVNAEMLFKNPPDIPEIHGPPKGKTGVDYEYEFCASDPDGDDIYFCYDWGDGSGEDCIGPFPSGICIKLNHTWTADGTYTIKCKARDINQEESEYATLNVEMPRVFLRPFLLKTILEKIYERILNYLIVLL
ncbi:MAG: hypothetical protein AYK22_00515 [Thermoplasmatales archaeon SG8-52-3]|nr:MAG: hypothetical protein AYK22_00515 [Thermoplasmatales archaeon SG8-52-3]